MSNQAKTLPKALTRSALERQNRGSTAAFASQLLFGTLITIAAAAPCGLANAEEEAIEEIVVTALKRSQSLQEIPSAVSVIGAQDIEERGIKDLHDIKLAVPSLHYSEYLGQANINIRGVGDFAGNPGVSVSLDGVYQPTSVTSKLAQLDLDRIEILRGPQGTLYGRNSNGGVVNFISTAPSHESSGYVRVGYAEYEEYNLAAAYGGSIGERMAFRVAVDHTDSNEGWVDNLADGQSDLMQGRNTAFRLRLLSQLSDSATLDLSYSRADSDGSFNHASMITDERFLTDPVIAAANVTLEPLETYSATDDNYDREYDLVSASLNWDWGFATLDSITAYQKFDENMRLDGGAYDVLVLDYDIDQTEIETISQELRLSGQTESFDWIVGGFYMDIDLQRLTHFNFPVGFAVFGLPPGAELEFGTDEYDTESFAFFVDGTWNITDRARLSVGARHTEDKIDFASQQSITFGPGLVFPTCAQEQDFKDSKTTLRAAGHYDITDSGSAYLSYSEGFKAGGVAIFECNPPYEPEEISAWELGTKWSFNGGKTTLNAAIFRYDYTDFQVAQVIGLAVITRNAGDANIDGLEVELQSQINQNWSVSGGVTLLDSEYEDFVNFDGLNPTAGFQELEGNRLNKTPKASINLGVSYTAALGNGSSLTVRADGSYRSRTYFREFNAREDSQGAYTVVNLNIIWESNERTWVGRLYANNLTDEEYIQDISGDATTGGRFGQWGMPRQIGVEISRNFF